MAVKRPDPIAFMSYVHADDEAGGGRLTSLRARLEQEVQVQTGGPFRIFQDRTDLQWGDAWRERINASLDQVTFLIPIVTPSFFTSDACRAEFERFVERERQLGRGDLILPIYYVNSKLIEDAEERTSDSIAAMLAERQFADWRGLRFESLNSRKVGRALEDLALQIARALGSRHMEREAEPQGVGPVGKSAAVEEVAGLGAEVLAARDDIGLTRIYPSFDACQPEILDEVTTSRNVKIFVQMGKSVLSGAAVLYEALERSQPETQIKILHAGMRSPYLSERIALNRGSDYREWGQDIQYTTIVGDRLTAKLGSRLELRQHREGYFWRLFIFDDHAYLQPYLYPRDNARRAPVLRFSRLRANAGGAQNPDSLYHMLTTFFDFKWEECAPAPKSLEDMIAPTETAAVVALVKRERSFVFVVPKRFLDQHDGELPFHSIGGKRQKGEDWIQTLQRECMEEIGSRLEVRSSAFTREITTSAEFEPINLSNEPRPYCVYKRTRDMDPEVVEPEVLWIVGYEADLDPAAAIEPRSEIAAVVHLTNDMLRRTARGRVTYAQIRRSKDGSGVQVQAGVDFDYERVAVPTGLAALPILRNSAG
jgi:hypothetical protein